MVELSKYNDGVYNEGIYNLTISGANSFSLTANGTNQFFSTRDFQSVGVANAWTLSFWIKPSGNAETSAVFEMAGVREQNQFRLTFDPLPFAPISDFAARAKANIVTQIKGSEGTIIKHIKWEDFALDDEWIHGAVTWDGADLVVYASGIALSSGVSFVNTSGTMDDSEPRKIFYGGTIAGTVSTVSGNLGHLGLWGSVLAQPEIQEIATLGFDLDLTTNSGSYTSSASLQAYYKPGEDADALGFDYSGNNRVLDKDQNFNEGSVVTDRPGGFTL